MRTLPAIGAVLTAAAMTAACASSGASGLSWNVGQATAADAQNESVQIFRQYQYEIERAEGPPSIYIITRWRPRTPFDDERALGVEEAQTRWILEARARQRDPTRQDLYTVRLRVENEGRMESAMDFETLEPTPEFEEYANRLAADLGAVLEMGIRRP